MSRGEAGREGGRLGGVPGAEEGSEQRAARRRGRWRQPSGAPGLRAEAGRRSPASAPPRAGPPGEERGGLGCQTPRSRAGRCCRDVVRGERRELSCALLGFVRCFCGKRGAGGCAGLRCAALPSGSAATAERRCGGGLGEGKGGRGK